MGTASRIGWIAALSTLLLASAAFARNWGSVDFDLVMEGVAAAEKIRPTCGTTLRYQRLREGDLLSDSETFVVHEDMYEDEPAFRVELERHDDTASGGETVTHQVFLDGATLRPLQLRKDLAGTRQWEETVFERDEAVVSQGGTTSYRVRTDSDTLDLYTLQLMFLKFVDDPEKIRFSFVHGDVLYRFHATLKDPETIVLGSSSYETMHVVCKMRGTWYHLAPALHFWIEAAPPHRLVRYQARREVVELIE